jgi:hypothetical protein
MRAMRIKQFARSATAIGLAFASGAAIAQPTYVSGHINDITFAWDAVLIRVDAGLPDNCAGTSYGWMKIPVENKSMNAFVVGLWMRGDAQQVVVTVYTDGLLNGYCRVTQIDPAG